MKIALLVIIVAAIVIRVVGFLPWTGSNSQQSNGVGFRFLAGVGLAFLTLIFLWFWFVMKPH